MSRIPSVRIALIAFLTCAPLVGQESPTESRTKAVESAIAALKSIQKKQTEDAITATKVAMFDTREQLARAKTAVVKPGVKAIEFPKDAKKPAVVGSAAMKEEAVDALQAKIEKQAAAIERMGKVGVIVRPPAVPLPIAVSGFGLLGEGTVRVATILDKTTAVVDCSYFESATSGKRIEKRVILSGVDTSALADGSPLEPGAVIVTGTRKVGSTTLFVTEPLDLSSINPK